MSVAFTVVGAVRRINVPETVTTMAVPLVADLTRAWFVDSVELVWLLLHFALMNLDTIAQFVIDINAKGPNE